MFKLSSLFYLIPVYFFVIAPLLRQLLPSDPSPYSDNGNKYEEGGEEEEEEESPLLLNPEFLSIDDGEPLTCAPDNYRVHLFSQTPLIIYIEDFLSVQEADHLVNISVPNYTPSIIYNGQTTTVDPRKRHSDRALLPRDATVRCIESRAKAFQGWKPHLHIERMWAQRYNVSGHYVHHYDWADSARSRGGDRLSTFMVYLAADCEGGGTNFPRLRKPRDRSWCRFIECDDTASEAGGDGKGQGVTFKPVKGNAVFWENLRPDGSGYPETWHAAFPVTRGEKVGLNIWSWYQHLGGGGVG
ncbi:hypothetical protein ARAM_005189 [Aspergillus rambellii]|uniref:Prolyl 4-hydroxylase alpha subunit domain-containing protein n=1 Tax=Aspergillus rambellii TaxID=308745 RepID=A0A0F8UJ79_9EURO|nr:hypothetical protein ARAM_005189 [Aspergillus rambellii]